MPKITTLLLDCDNTLVLSESLAFEACAGLANKILASHSISATYTGPQLLSEFVGQNFRGMLTSLARKHDLSIPPEEMQAYVSAEEDEVIAKLEEKLEPCIGVDPVLQGLEEEGRYTLAVVSSSALRRVQASIVKVGHDRYFGDRVYSAATSLPTPTSKPDPAIYLWALEKLGVRAEECLAIEDSRSGATAACRAGIKTVGYTGSYEVEERERMEGVLWESGCVVLMGHWREFGGMMERIEKGEL